MTIIATLIAASAWVWRGHESIQPRGYLSQAMEVIKNERGGPAVTSDRASLSRVYADAARDWGEITPPAGLSTAHAQVGQAFATAAAEAMAIDPMIQMEPTAAAAIPPRVLFGPLESWSSSVKQVLDVIPVVLIGESMKPALCSGDIVYFTPFRGWAERWEIVSLNTSVGGLVKRIVGLPGETIAISQGQIYIDNRELEDNYRLELPLYFVTDRTLGADEYFVLGDNRNYSADSTDPKIGPIPEDAIEGVAPANTRGCR